MKNFLLILISLFFVACGPKHTDDTSVSSVSIDSNGFIVEHTSYQNQDAEDMLERCYSDSSFYAEIAQVSVFNKRVKEEVANYLLSHLKEVKTLRMLGVTHHYDLNVHEGSYYVTYFKNNRTQVAYGCKLNKRNGRYRIEYQHVRADNKEFKAAYDSASVQTPAVSMPSPK
jgi:DNA-binding transcriptional regulator WhiA